MINQHPTAIVSKKAKLGENIEVGPFAVIQDGAEIGNGCHIGPHAVIYSGARIGNNVKIYQGGSIAHKPQDLKFGNEETFVFVGDNTVIHEFVTLHRGTKETGKTVIGSDALLMAYSHVAHDCRIGNRVILANSVQIGGHVHVDDWVIVGGCTPIHQFCLVGKHAMIGGGFRITQDVPPFILMAGEPLKFSGLNVIGLRRRGFTNEQILILKETYSYIYNPQYNVSQAKEIITGKFGSNELVADVLSFIESSKRGLAGK
jgi:UDP-N-acetylglucosamine acyltransferase